MRKTLRVPGKRRKISEWDAGKMTHSVAYWGSLRNKAKRNLDMDPVRESFEAQVQDATIKEEDRYRFIQDGIKEAMSTATTMADSDLAEKFPYTNLDVVKNLINNDPETMHQLQLDESSITPEDLIALNEDSLQGAYSLNSANIYGGKAPRDLRTNPNYPQMQDFVRRNPGSTALRRVKARGLP